MKRNSFYTRLSAQETSESIKDLVELQKQQIKLLNQILTEEKGNLGQLKEERYKLEFEEDSQSIYDKKLKEIEFEELMEEWRKEEEEIEKELLGSDFYDEYLASQLEALEAYDKET